MAPAPRARAPRGRSVEKSSPNSATLLHGDGALLQRLEDAGDRVLDRSHDKAIEQRDVARRPGACLNAAARKELEILKNGEEALLPSRYISGFDRGKRAGDATPVSAISCSCASRLVPVFRFPDVPGDFSDEVIHNLVPNWISLQSLLARALQ